MWASIRFCSRVRCTAWRPICIRFLCQLRAPALVVPASVAAVAAEDSPAEALVAAAEARFRPGGVVKPAARASCRRDSVAAVRILLSYADTTFLLLIFLWSYL